MVLKVEVKHLGNLERSGSGEDPLARFYEHGDESPCSLLAK
jgi:hypothetical protein